MKLVALLALLFALPSYAADAIPQRAVDLAKSSINQYILVASGIGGAFPNPNAPDALAQAKADCVSAGTATVGFALLRTFHFTDAEIAPLLAPTSAAPSEIEKLALKSARECGLLF